MKTYTVTWRKRTDQFTDAGEVEADDLDDLMAKLVEALDGAYVPTFDEQVTKAVDDA